VSPDVSVSCLKIEAAGKNPVEIKQLLCSNQMLSLAKVKNTSSIIHPLNKKKLTSIFCLLVLFYFGF
jgi:hypothetical protein